MNAVRLCVTRLRVLVLNFVRLSVIRLRVFVLNFVRLSAIKLGVIMMNAISLSNFRLSLVLPKFISLSVISFNVIRLTVNTLAAVASFYHPPILSKMARWTRGLLIIAVTGFGQFASKAINGGSSQRRRKCTNIHLLILQNSTEEYQP